MYFHQRLDTLCRAKTINGDEWVLGSHVRLNHKDYIFYDDSDSIEEKIAYEEINIRTLCNFTGIYFNCTPLFTADIVLIEFRINNQSRLYVPFAENYPYNFNVYQFYNKIIFDEKEYRVNSFNSFIGDLNHNTAVTSCILGNMFDSQDDKELFAAPLIKL